MIIILFVIKPLLLLLTLLLSISVNAQKTRYTGTVLDASDNEPIIGATILEQGTTNGTTTGFDGQFEIEAHSGCIFEISHISYHTLVTPATHTTLPYYLQPYARFFNKPVLFNKNQELAENKKSLIHISNEH